MCSRGWGEIGRRVLDKMAAANSPLINPGLANNEHIPMIGFISFFENNASKIQIDKKAPL
jgi:hypothetical protein